MTIYDALLMMILGSYLTIFAFIGFQYIIKNNVLGRLIEDVEWRIYKSLERKFTYEVDFEVTDN